MIARLVAIGILSASAALAAQEPESIISYTLYAAGPCDGIEYVPAFIGARTAWFSPPGAAINGSGSGSAMPDADLWVIGATLTTEYPSLNPKYFAATAAYSGIENGLGGDVVNSKINGPQTQATMFPPGAAMKLAFGDIAERHVDVHIRCPAAGNATWQATLTVYTIR